MKTPITLLTNTKLSRRYRALLTEDWSKQSLAKTLDLLADQLRPSEQEHIRNGEALSQLSGLLPSFVRLPAKKNSGQHTRPRADRPDRLLASQTERAIFFLLLQFSHTVEGDSALFADSQSLLYLCTIHVLLPALDRKEMTNERGSLVAALWLHCFTWESDVAHMLYLRSTLFRYLDMAADETRDLVQAFRLTDPDEHDYVTKAQAAWMSMLEQDQASTAKDFMLDVYRTCPPSARAEVREILDETYELARAGQRPTEAG